MALEKLQPFQIIKYTTSDGENCSATKNNGIVTIQGDKNGVRQMPLNEFMEIFIKDQSKKTLERTPEKDTVSFSGNYREKSIYEGLKVKNGFLGMGKRTIKGSIAGRELDLKLSTGGFWTTKTTLSGTIDGRPVNLVMKKGTIEGQLDNRDRDLAPVLRQFLNDKLNYDEQAAMAAFMVC